MILSVSGLILWYGCDIGWGWGDKVASTVCCLNCFLSTGNSQLSGVMVGVRSQVTQYHS
jgi:hypothetical protein